MSFRYYSYLRWLRMDIPSEFRYLAKVGKSHAYVCGRLRLTQLIPEVKQAFYEAKLTVAHAFEIAQLQPLWALVKMRSGCQTCYF